jgi:hypothetical protein
MQFDVITISVLAGVIYGPLAAHQASATPAQPWSSVSARLRLLVIAALAWAAIAIVALAALGRWPLAVLLAMSSGVSYLVSRHRRSLAQRD